MARQSALAGGVGLFQPPLGKLDLVKLESEAAVLGEDAAVARMDRCGLPQDDECLLLVARGPQPAGVVEGGIGTAWVLGVGLAPVLDTALGAGLGAHLGIGTRQQPPIGVGEGGQRRTGASRQQGGTGEPGNTDTGKAL
jgi:hypothetical protein